LLDSHRRTWTDRLSGGNRRKLSVACALLGRPPVVLLDEPTIGIDAGARASLWPALCDARTGGMAMVVASHSAEEVEAVCSRHAVLFHGTLGNCAQTLLLCEAFGKAFALSVLLRPQADLAKGTQLESATLKFLQALLPPPVSCEGSCDRWRFKFQLAKENSGVVLARIFTSLEEAMAPGGALPQAILDYEVLCLSVDEMLSNEWQKVSPKFPTTLEVQSL